MAGTLTIDTLKASSGVLATQNGMNGICKAWAAFNGGTQAIIGSFNVSSITRVTTGQFTINFTTAMPDTNFADFGGGAKVSDAINFNNYSCIPSTIGSLKTVNSGTIYAAAVTNSLAYDSPYITYAAFR